MSLFLVAMPFAPSSVLYPPLDFFQHQKVHGDLSGLGHGRTTISGRRLRWKDHCDMVRSFDKSILFEPRREHVSRMLRIYSTSATPRWILHLFLVYFHT